MPKNDNTNVNVLQLGSQTYATTDSSMSWKFDLESLESEKLFNLADKIPVPMTASHSHTGYYIVCLSMRVSLKLSIARTRVATRFMFQIKSFST